MKKALFISLFFVLVVLGASSEARACFCALPSADTSPAKLVEDAKAEASAVFVGRVRIQIRR